VPLQQQHVEWRPRQVQQRVAHVWRDGRRLRWLLLRLMLLRRNNKVRLRVLDARLDQPRDSLLFVE
jgi:hypothetical protein